MTPPETDLPLDTKTINDTIRHAQRLGASCPELTTLAALEKQLRRHIAVLLPTAQTPPAHGNGAEETAHARRLASIRAQLSRGLGHGRLSAHVQVAALTQDCQWLLDHRGDHRGEGDRR